MHSMTGFGSAEHATSSLVARVEASSVNRKQGEVIVQLPRTYAELEPEIRKSVLGKLSRGRVTVTIQIEQSEGAAAPIRINAQRARALEVAFTELSAVIDRPLQATSADFMRIPDIFDFDGEQISSEKVIKAILPALNEAVEKMITMRASEGAHLKKDIENRLLSLVKIAEKISDRAPAVTEYYREQLHRRLNESGLTIDLHDERLFKEIGIFAERCDISEEITRLQSHFDKFREYLEIQEPVGRPLDFLCQELNREFNTLGSKANDATLAQHIVNAKTELEKIREQVQNIE